MTATVVDELVAILGYKVEGEELAKRYEASLNLSLPQLVNWVRSLRTSVKGWGDSRLQPAL